MSMLNGQREMRAPPPGYLSFRDAIVLLASTKAPDARVSDYLQRRRHPELTGETLLTSAGQVADKWYCVGDPFEWPISQNQTAALSLPETARAGEILAYHSTPEPAWLALEAARSELASALILGGLAAFRENEATTLQPLKSSWWRYGSEPREALRTGRWTATEGAQFWLCLREAEFERWLNPNNGVRPRRSQAAVDRWMVAHTSERQVRRDDAISACMALLSGATYAQCRDGWNKLPDKIRGRQGVKKPGAKSG